MTYDLLLRNGEIVLPGEGRVAGSVAVKDGRIAAILAASETAHATRVIDCTGKWILPGAIDPHTHIGFGANEADWTTESRTAALQGVTGLMTFWRSDDLDISTPGWRLEGEARSVVDFGFHFGVTSRAHVEQFPALAAKYGVTSLKVYLMYKGATGAAKGITEVDDALLFRALRTAATVKGAVVGVHCENTEVIPVFREPLKDTGRMDLAAWDEQSPGFLETENVFRVAYFGEKAGCAVNIVHMSSAESLELVRRLRAPNRPAINVETCIHYLSLTRDVDIGNLGKVNPPLRSQSDVDALWEGVRDGAIQTIGSDHVARKRATKGPDIWRASAGFPGIAQIWPVMIEEGYYKRDIPIETLAATVSRNVAALYYLPCKGRIAPGYEADFAVLDPDGATTVSHGNFPSHSDYSPYEERRFRGAVTHTILRGTVLSENGILTPGFETAPYGQYLFRTP